jgi:hypothetical protein
MEGNNKLARCRDAKRERALKAYRRRAARQFARTLERRERPMVKKTAMLDQQFEETLRPVRAKFERTGESILDLSV